MKMDSSGESYDEKSLSPSRATRWAVKSLILGNFSVPQGLTLIRPNVIGKIGLLSSQHPPLSLTLAQLDLQIKLLAGNNLKSLADQRVLGMIN